MSWMEYKQQAENSIKAINNFCYTNALKLSRKPLYELSIKTSGKGRLWKTIYNNGNNISEGYQTWREVAAFLSGMRRVLIG